MLGGPWRTDSPTFIDALPNLLIELHSSGGSSGVSACSNIAEIPAGMVITQSGNVVNILTNAQCITLPENVNFFVNQPYNLDQQIILFLAASILLLPRQQEL